MTIRAKDRPDINGLRHVQRHPGFAHDYEREHDAHIIPRHKLELEDLRDEGDEERRRFNPTAVVIRRPNVQEVIASALQTTMNELARLEESSMGPQGLDSRQIARLSKLIDGAAKLSREQRALDEREEHEMSNLAPEQIKERAKQALAVLEGDE